MNKDILALHSQIVASGGNRELVAAVHALDNESKSRLVSMLIKSYINGPEQQSLRAGSILITITPFVKTSDFENVKLILSSPFRGSKGLGLILLGAISPTNEEIIKLLLDNLRDSSPSVRGNAATSLMLIKLRLDALENDSDPDVRKNAKDLNQLLNATGFEKEFIQKS